MSRTLLDAYIAMTNAQVNHYSEKVDSELQWLEGHIRDLRKEVERGQVFEQINLVTAAARVAHSAGKLATAQEKLAAFIGLEKEGK